MDIVGVLPNSPKQTRGQIQVGALGDNSPFRACEISYKCVYSRGVTYKHVMFFRRSSLDPCFQAKGEQLVLKRGKLHYSAHAQ